MGRFSNAEYEIQTNAQDREDEYNDDPKGSRCRTSLDVERVGEDDHSRNDRDDPGQVKEDVPEDVHSRSVLLCDTVA